MAAGARRTGAENAGTRATFTGDFTGAAVRALLAFLAAGAARDEK
jgi:hypothetical protein